ncbi:AEL078Cp [Eremothecium gossypii ATCC 10895]|uniref:AEL078Cp n=1 Tax=Eremothecium gossypii (strain ATCC 10895 / CBS 109.51 / FGSC 9923 / NRRL Y-1056) TaxID=284811 RepID=Q757U0_EREGS|nr:mitochondrial 54S ribosomal protein YmL10/YmL18 [Eremothecium gossypii ATCC 10895]AAS52607.1 AEL078Cp [Eremothecium gossypii ATCC 10895]AEY96910.1 FAEL078Cp [Eremothecium gossypii FDAG1]
MFSLLTVRLGSLRGLSSPVQQPARFMSLLGSLRPSEGSTKTYKRVGRGPSSGKGKTAGRGQKGQKARGHVKSWFEGGQTPIYKLFPKLGFTNVHSLQLRTLNLERIMWFHRKGRLPLEEGEVLDMKKMKDFGLVTGTFKDGVKILANGKENFNIPIQIEATRASSEAIKAIEAAGGGFTARYFNRLSLRAHLSPHWFLEKRGRIPLPARPTKKKDINYYSDMNKRGYLVKEQHPLYLEIQRLRALGTVSGGSKRAKKTALEIQLEAMEESAAVAPSAPSKSAIISLQELQQ